jgi:hypothetical protein
MKEEKSIGKVVVESLIRAIAMTTAVSFVMNQREKRKAKKAVE